MDVRSPLGRGREVGPDSFTDLTATPVEAVAWGSDGQIVVTFAADVTADVAQAVEDRVASSNANEETLRRRGRAALVKNRDYLANASPTQAQVVAQVAALTRQHNALIRKFLGDFDGTD